MVEEEKKLEVLEQEEKEKEQEEQEEEEEGRAANALTPDRSVKYSYLAQSILLF